jgi:hypothetical protein
MEETWSIRGKSRVLFEDHALQECATLGVIQHIYEIEAKNVKRIFKFATSIHILYIRAHFSGKSFNG